MHKVVNDFSSLQVFVRKYCQNKLCKDCDMRDGKKCVHPKRPDAKLIQHASCK